MTAWGRICSGYPNHTAASAARKGYVSCCHPSSTGFEGIVVVGLGSTCYFAAEDTYYPNYLGKLGTARSGSCRSQGLKLVPRYCTACTASVAPRSPNLCTVLIGHRN